MKEKCRKTCDFCSKEKSKYIVIYINIHINILKTQVVSLYTNPSLWILGGISYEITRLGFLCSNVRHEIKSEAECKNAAAILGLKWAHVWNGPKDFPGCLYAQDWRNKVFFNLSPNPGRVNVSPKYSAICIVDKGTLVILE